VASVVVAVGLVLLFVQRPRGARRPHEGAAHVL
jgi:hypothetical protein